MTLREKPSDFAIAVLALPFADASDVPPPGLKLVSWEGLPTNILAIETEIGEEERHIWEAALEQLSPRESYVLLAPFEEERVTHKEMADRLGVHRSRIGQLQEDALAKISKIILQLPGYKETYRLKTFDDFLDFYSRLLHEDRTGYAGTMRGQRRPAPGIE